MSCVPVDAAAEACANCGKEANDAVKLKNCTACFLVKYCGADCQKVHRKQHKKACKERAAELKDEKLYTQGTERAEADFCPLCLLAIPMPVAEHSQFYYCCMKKVCNGCLWAAKRQGIANTCAFCRTTAPKNNEEGLALVQNRVAAKNPEAICHLGAAYFRGTLGLEKNEPRAIKLWSEAAELGSAAALCRLGCAYDQGDGGVTPNKAKALRCFESAAMKGHMQSRHNLGAFELKENENFDRALRHYLISAKMGFKESIDIIRGFFTFGQATKAQYADALKCYQGAVEETKSDQREEAARLHHLIFPTVLG